MCICAKHFGYSDLTRTCDTYLYIKHESTSNYGIGEKLYTGQGHKKGGEVR